MKLIVKRGTTRAEPHGAVCGSPAFAAAKVNPQEQYAFPALMNQSAVGPTARSPGSRQKCDGLARLGVAGMLKILHRDGDEQT